MCLPPKPPDSTLSVPRLAPLLRSRPRQLPSFLPVAGRTSRRLSKGATHRKRRERESLTDREDLAPREFEGPAFFRRPTDEILEIG
eukprot:scaffold96271_cov12-Tisochrysis_lutea.AAC.1